MCIKAKETKTHKYVLLAVLIALAVSCMLLLVVDEVKADDKKTVSYGNLSLEIAPAGSEDARKVVSVDKDGQSIFCLPSGVDDEVINYGFDKSAVEFKKLNGSVASVFYESDNPDSKGRAYVEDSRNHTLSSSGTFYMYSKDFQLKHKGKVKKLRGRGNSTWNAEKKPYQINLDKSVDLLDTDNGSQKAKKWLLLSNPYDQTLLRNELIYDFSRKVGLTNTPEGFPVDFYYDGEYRGLYYLCEKNEVGKGRVEIDDLDKDNEEVNGDIEDSLDNNDGKFSLKTVKINGLEMKYVSGVKNPADIKGGYLLELDRLYYKDEPGYFQARGDDYFAIKSPEYPSEEQCKYISELVRGMYRCIYNNGKDPKTGKKLFDYVDKSSFVKYYLVMEWFKNEDGYKTSTFFYKPRNKEKLYVGPVWDCDATMDNRRDTKVTNGWFSQFMALKFMEIKDVRIAVKKEYTNNFRKILRNNVFKNTERIKEKNSLSIKMNYTIWPIEGGFFFGGDFPFTTFEEYYDETYTWMKNRDKWFDKNIMAKSYILTKKEKDAIAKRIKKAKATKVKKFKVKSNAARSAKVTWGKVKGVSGYQVIYSTNKKFSKSKTKLIKGANKQKYTIKKLKSKKNYYFKIRAYTSIKNADGKTIKCYGKWSKSVKRKIK